MARGWENKINIRKLFLKTLLLLTAYGLLLTAADAMLDPTEIGVGARALGMGKAVVGLAEDSSAIFINPAGLALNESLNITSMQGNLLQDVGYILFGLSENSPYGSMGLGLVNVSVFSIPLTTWDGSNVVQYGSTDYSSSLVIFSYGNQYRGIKLGGNIKYFTQGFSVTSGSLEGGTGVGLDLDLGFQGNFNSWSSWGVVLQNALPQNWGGRFIWRRNNLEEGIPLSIKLGSGFKILGLKGIKKLGNHELTLGIDFEKYYSLNRPHLWHVGVEWWLHPILALRLGIDQKPRTETTVDNNLSAGVGLKYRGFTFDVAYHQYGEIAENATYFFSLGYVGEKKKKEAREEVSSDLKGVPMPKVLPKPKLKTFVDVLDNYWAKSPIEYLATLGIMEGDEDNAFKPEKEVTRAELVVILVKAKELGIEKVSKGTFSDLDPHHWTTPYIEAAVDHEYIGGYEDGTFKPYKKITRAEVAIVLAKFGGLYVKEEIKEKSFPDLSRRHWASPAVAAVKTEGFLEYLSGKNFEARKFITRAELAEILSKVPFLKNKIKNLLSEGQ